MGLKSGHKVDAGINSAGMQDVVFLLLIFFILTSNNVVKDVVPINAPKSDVHRVVVPDLKVTIAKSDEDKLIYYVNSIEFPLSSMKGEIQKHINDFKEKNKIPMVVISADEKVTLRDAFEINNIVSSLGGKPSFSVNKQKNSNAPAFGKK